MKAQEAWAQTRDILHQRTGAEAHLEAELLLRHHLGVDRTRFYLSLANDLSAKDLAELNTLLARRLAGEPLAHILGRREFYGLNLLVAPGVLIPRPETELLVEQALDFIKRRFGTLNYPILVADVGTGSGAVAIALAAQLPTATFVATDISAICLKVAHRNALRHGVHRRMHFIQGDLLYPLSASFDLIVANLPYVKYSDWLHLPDEIRLHESTRALLGGEDGLALIRRLLSQAPARLQLKGALFLEIGSDQGPAVCTLAQQAFLQGRITVAQDWAGLDRVVSVET